MDSEGVLFAALIDGPLQACDVPMNERTRAKWAKRLEDAGYLTRTRRTYELTPEGLRYAYETRGLQPRPHFSIEPRSVRDYPELSTAIAVRPVSLTIFTWLVVAVACGVFEYLVMKITGYMG